MTSLARREFHFHNVALVPVHDREDVWFTSSDLAKALGYASTKSISNLYAGNSDEFSHAMSMVIRVMTNGINNNLREKKVRIFSLRGAHLIAMFARTDVAKEFRHWVLDILDREISINTPVSSRPTNREVHAYNANALAHHYEVMYTAWKTQIYPALKAIESPLASRLYDRFADGNVFMSYVMKEAEEQLKEGEVARIF